MTRHSLAFTILALFGLALVLPDPSFARGPSFRPAFTGGPFRIVLPTGRLHGHAGPRIGRPAVTLPARGLVSTFPPLARSVAAGMTPFRLHHRGHARGSYYPGMVGGSYYGSPYDPSDIPVYGPLAATDEALAPVFVPPRLAAPPERGCRAQQVTVPNATRGGESAITIVRC